MKPKISITLPQELLDVVDAAAKDVGTNRSDMLVRILARGLRAGGPFPTIIEAAMAAQEKKS